MSLHYRIIPARGTDAAVRSTMYRLMAEHYDNSQPERFAADLEAKSHLILLEDGAGSLAGFSTVLVYESLALGARVVYSGDTIIDPQHWGSPCLFYAFGAILKEAMDSLAQGQRAYWFLLSKGIRTYGLLPLFFNDYWPCPSPGPAAQALRPILDSLADEKFGSLYHQASGLIPAKADYLKPRLAVIPPHKAHQPMVQFFLERNPDYGLGTELACITEIRIDNIKGPARRFVR